MAKQDFSNELTQLQKYLRSEENEDAKRALLFPLFSKLFKEQMRSESAAKGCDIYIEARLVVEAKSKYSQWLEGFYQALFYHRKQGLSYHTILVIAHKFIGIWKVNDLPKEVIVYIQTADIGKSPSATGKELARKTQASLKRDIQAKATYWLEPSDLDSGLFAGGKSLIQESYQVLNLLKNLESQRIQVNSHNFIDIVNSMKSFFDKPIDAVHAFYSIVAYWDITSTVAIQEVLYTPPAPPEGGSSFPPPFGGAGGEKEAKNLQETRIIGFKGSQFSDAILIPAKKVLDFKRFIEKHYIFTNEGSGLTADYYFGRFDEVLSTVMPEYVKQHGIFFTDNNLAKFALWYVANYCVKNVEIDYIVFDPAGGSGNLISSWRKDFKHKIVSELQPDLLKTIEKRMKIDPFHTQKGFTIIPKTSQGVGLNFLDKSAQSYFDLLSQELKNKMLSFDKPLAFLLNPPYKNTDENEKFRQDTEAAYDIHPEILEICGNDAAKERYLAFLAQILGIIKTQVAAYPSLSTEPIVMVFTPTSWLIPRPTYLDFRSRWDKYFAFQAGFMVASNEFFKLDGKWPLAFTVWKYKPDKNREIETLTLHDTTTWKQQQLNLNWFEEETVINEYLTNLMQEVKTITLRRDRKDIRDLLPLILRKGEWVKQTRCNLYRNRIKEEANLKIVSGFPLKDDRHTRIKAPHGYVDGEYIGFMDDNTPVRLRQEPSERFSNQPDRVWFRLDTVFININQTKTFNGAADNRSYCAYDIASAKVTFTWFVITKVLNNRYPLWANQYDIWQPDLSKVNAEEWYALCFAFVLAENRCIETKFEANNPVQGAPEVIVHNPLSTNHSTNFWNKVLYPYLLSTESFNSPPAPPEGGSEEGFTPHEHLEGGSEKSFPPPATSEGGSEEGFTPHEHLEGGSEKSSAPPSPPKGGSFSSPPLGEQGGKQPPVVSLSKELIQAIQNFYQYWATTYCKGQILYYTGLQEEPYFKYFDYPDYLTVNAGLVQIRKYAEVNQCADLQERWEIITNLTKKVRERLWEMLVKEMGYFA